MTKTRYISHPIRPTTIGMKVLRARLSLRETQPEFAKRFKVSHITVHKWETGKVLRMQHVYAYLLDGLVTKLKAEGRWLPEDIFSTVWHTELERKGDARYA